MGRWPVRVSNVKARKVYRFLAHHILKFKMTSDLPSFRLHGEGGVFRYLWTRRLHDFRAWRASIAKRRTSKLHLLSGRASSDIFCRDRVFPLVSMIANQNVGFASPLFVRSSLNQILKNFNPFYLMSVLSARGLL